jgi:uncharacterized protein YjiS (DUF1127 family)
MVTLALPRRASKPWFAPVREAAARLRLWRTRARGRQLLLGFDEHMLRDLGICSARAEFEGRKPFWRD